MERLLTLLLRPLTRRPSYHPAPGTSLDTEEGLTREALSLDLVDALDRLPRLAKR